MRLIQMRSGEGTRLVAALDDAGEARRIEGVESVYALAQIAIDSNESLSNTASRLGFGGPVDLAAAERDGRLLPPIDHPDPAHLLLTGTGLTHLGSAESRDEMHRKEQEDAITDSIRMFRMGLEGGKPEAGEAGVQPEWFYKGDGTSLVAPGAALFSPTFALDGGEEPELAGIYLIDREGAPWRLGVSLANEFSDHVTERTNYLWLAHSKLRPAALGPELLTGEVPDDIQGMCRIRRTGQTVWEKPFATGEANMSHSLANLEHHHFKYAAFRRPGDVHVHFFGTATLSFADGMTAAPGDEFEIAAPPFLMPLRNPLAVAPDAPIAVRSL